jgi:thioredoxin 1
MQKIQSEEEFQKIISQPELLVVNWFAEWNGPSKAIKPEFYRLESENPTVRFAMIDVDETGDLSAKEGVKFMPTFYFYKDGKRVDSLRGASKEALRDMVAKHK